MKLPENEFLVPFQQDPRVYVFKHLPTGVIAGITTSLLGNFAQKYQEDNIEKRNNLALQEMFNCGSYHKLKVVHKNKVDLVRLYHHKSEFHAETDAVIFSPEIHGQKVALPNYHVMLMSNTADCAIVCLTNDKKDFSAIVHSGSKGIRLNIVGKTIREIESKLNVKPSSLVAALWPGIHQDDYEFGPEVFDYVLPKFIKIIKDKTGTHYYLSQKQAIHDQLLKAGVQINNIHTAPDNFHHTAWEVGNKRLFYSHRLKDKERNCVFIAI